MQNLQDAMNNYTITAPISGTIIEKDAKVGDAVKAGDTLCIVYDHELSGNEHQRG